MYAADRQREVLRDGAAIDLSFSQILEVRSSSQQRRRRPQPSATNGRFASRQLPPGSLKMNGGPGSGSMLDSVYESDEVLEESGSSSLDESQRFLTRVRHSSSTEDEEWTNGDDGQLGQDMYRFVQPRRLSSWVQDDAVFACFKCHTVFSLLVRKHHCR